MISIKKAGPEHAVLLSELAAQTFLESHGNSASPEDIAAYVAAHYTPEILKTELEHPANIYHIQYYNKQAVGFSKIVLNAPFEGSSSPAVAKLERIYLLKGYYGTNLGPALMDFLLHLMKKEEQVGVWLYVWKENQRAIRFYEKKGFTINGSYDFPITDTHTNPNHRMYLSFSASE
jgi:ribosomal protein S18 acetylase RimI-like enzyme